MKVLFLRLTMSLLIVTLAGCSLIPNGHPPATATPNFPQNDFRPQPTDELLQRDQVTLDLPHSQVVAIGKSPVLASLNLKGSLPDPCHQLRIVGTRDDVKKQINLEVYSVFTPGKACTTVTKPFNVTIALGDYAGGHYYVYENGQIVGDFDT
jgi:hypothetical protein